MQNELPRLSLWDCLIPAPTAKQAEGGSQGPPAAISTKLLRYSATEGSVWLPGSHTRTHACLMHWNKGCRSSEPCLKQAFPLLAGLGLSGWVSAPGPQGSRAWPDPLLVHGPQTTHFPQTLLAPLLLALCVAAAAAVPPTPEHCEPEMNKIKDLLQVSCVGKGLLGIPAGLPKDTGILLLGSNSLARVAMASFQHLQQLSELDLSNNSLEALEASTPLPKLQQLLLSHNSLGSLPDFWGLPGLKRLALGHNNISRVPEGGFRDLGQLRDLELQGNRLRRLPAGAFQGLGELRDLDLSENLLEGLPPDLLAELPNLEILRLERNRLRRVPAGFFSEEAAYAYVYLAGNPRLCDCQLLYLKRASLSHISGAAAEGGRGRGAPQQPQNSPTEHIF
ncbi:LOW QUALITY PROTEIN: uncharacterized protein PHA67_018452 [Liasis olivaceus]